MLKENGKKEKERYAVSPNAANEEHERVICWKKMEREKRKYMSCINSVIKWQIRKWKLLYVNTSTKSLLRTVENSKQATSNMLTITTYIIVKTIKSHDRRLYTFEGHILLENAAHCQITV